MKVKFLGWGHAKPRICLCQKDEACNVIMLERDVSNPKKVALEIDESGQDGIVPGHGVTVVYPSGKRMTFRYYF